MIFQVDPGAQVPTPNAPEAGDADVLLAQLLPTPTPSPVAHQGGAPGGYTQPTAVAVAPTPTLTPVFSVQVDPRAEDRENSADMGEASYLLTGFEWEQQGYNNCGPASFRVLMSYWGIELTEAEAASFLKPNPEDPNVRPDEIAAYAETLGYHVLVRVNGDFETLKRLLLAGYPVVIETGYDPEPTTVGWTSHYLTLAGFSEDGFIAMDTYRRPNWFYPYQEIDTYWRQFNRRYLVAYRDDQAVAIASIIGENMDDEIMYTSALNVASAELSLDRSDPFGWFNVGSNLVALERFEEAASAFDEARRLGLPGRFLWYQFTPFEAYMAVGRYEDVITIADAVLEKKANEEAFYYKGLALAAMGDADRARVQLSLALRANPSFQPAQDALDELEG
jgi:tetratricopeptide (TPR) repeat protein